MQRNPSLMFDAPQFCDFTSESVEQISEDSWFNVSHPRHEPITPRQPLPFITEAEVMETTDVPLNRISHKSPAPSGSILKSPCLRVPSAIRSNGNSTNILTSPPIKQNNAAKSPSSAFTIRTRRLGGRTSGYESDTGAGKIAKAEPKRRLDPARAVRIVTMPTPVKRRLSISNDARGKTSRRRVEKSEEDELEIGQTTPPMQITARRVCRELLVSPPSTSMTPLSKALLSCTMTEDKKNSENIRNAEISANTSMRLHYENADLEDEEMQALHGANALLEDMEESFVEQQPSAVKFSAAAPTFSSLQKIRSKDSPVITTKSIRGRSYGSEIKSRNNFSPVSRNAKRVPLKQSSVDSFNNIASK